MVIYYGRICKTSPTKRTLLPWSVHHLTKFWNVRFHQVHKGIPTRHLPKKHRRTTLIIDGSIFGAQQTMPFLCFVTLVLLNLWTFQATCFHLEYSFYVGVSKNRGIPKSSILIGFSIHFGIPLFLETPILCSSLCCDMIKESSIALQLPNSKDSCTCKWL